MSRLKTRNSKYELLRVFSICIIVLYHICYYGVIHNAGNAELYYAGSQINSFFCSLTQPGGQVGVGIFFVITGFFMRNTMPSDFFGGGYKKCIKIIEQVIFYSAISLLLMIAFIVTHKYSNYESISTTITSLIVTLFVPVSSGLWWFATAYVELLIITPFINKTIESFNIKQFSVILLFIWGFWYAIGKFGTHLYILYKALFFYLVGAFIGRIISKNHIHLSKSMIKMLAAVSGIGSWSGFVFLDIYIRKIELQSSLISYIAVNVAECLQSVFLVPICVISIFLIFYYLPNFESKTINDMASSTFAIYLLHDSFLIRSSLWNNIFAIPTIYEKQWFIIYSLGVVIILFLGGYTIDNFRKKYMDYLFKRCWKKIVFKFKNLK